MNTIAPKHLETLLAIRRLTLAHCRPPRLKDIAHYIGVDDVRRVDDHLVVLERRRLVQRGGGRTRKTLLTPAGLAVLEGGHEI